MAGSGPRRCLLATNSHGKVSTRKKSSPLIASPRIARMGEVQDRHAIWEDLYGRGANLGRVNIPVGGRADKDEGKRGCEGVRYGKGGGVSSDWILCTPCLLVSTTTALKSNVIDSYEKID